jgi:uncharacterized iron-regulated membrane protein
MRFKLSAHAFTRYWELHAWAGVTAGLVLYIMFLAGGLTLFHEPFETWEEPLAQTQAEGLGLTATLDRALTAHGSVPEDLWFFPAKAGQGEPRLAFLERGEWSTFWFDTKNGRLVRVRERAAHFIYNLHFLWHDTTGRWLYTLAGLLSVCLLLTLVTGVLIHAKDLLRQFHQFRPGKSRRVLWSDMHKVLGVMGLPFQIFYAYSGAFIVLAPLVLKVFAGSVFDGDQKRAAALAWDSFDSAGAASGVKAEGIALDELARRAENARPGFVPEYYHLLGYGRDSGIVEAHGSSGGTPSSSAVVRLREVDGKLLVEPKPESKSAATRRWIVGLHFAHFGGYFARFLLFFLALAGCGTILSGNWIWLSRRPQSRGNEALSRLTVGVGAGAWLALGALLLASRALPLDLAWRGAAEELTFLGVFGGCVLWAFIARDVAGLWWRILALASAVLLPVPFLAARWSSAGMFGSGTRLSSVVAVDVGLLGTAVLLGTIAAFLRRRAVRGSNTARDGRPAWTWGARVLACALLAWGVLSWSTFETGSAVALTIAVGLMSMNTAVTLLAPLWPRALWAAVALIALAIPMFSLAVAGR